MRRLATIVVVLSVVAPNVALAQEQAPASTAAPSKNERERRAQGAFIAGRYQDAVELLNGLYAEFHNPVYLRNIGRSYQRLKDPDRAIAAFEEYLRRDRTMKAAEREEIQGFIREMEELKRQREAPPPPPPPAVVATPAVPPVIATAPPVAATVPPAAVTPPPVPTVSTTPAPAASKGPGKIIGGVLLGAAALMAVGGGVFMATSWTEFNRGKREGCPGYFDCPKIAKEVERRALWGKILFGAAAATGIAGGTVLVLSLRSDSASAGTGVTVALQGEF